MASSSCWSWISSPRSNPVCFDVSGTEMAYPWPPVLLGPLSLQHQPCLSDQGHLGFQHPRRFPQQDHIWPPVCIAPPLLRTDKVSWLESWPFPPAVLYCRSWQSNSTFQLADYRDEPRRPHNLCPLTRRLSGIQQGPWRSVSSAPWPCTFGANRSNRSSEESWSSFLFTKAGNLGILNFELPPSRTGLGPPDVRVCLPCWLACACIFANYNCVLISSNFNLSSACVLNSSIFKLSSACSLASLSSLSAWS